MKLLCYTQMLLKYGIPELEPVDNLERNEMLLTYSYSVILEGSDMELENLDIWIKRYSGGEAVHSLYYGKIEYNYHIAEYFFSTELQAAEVAKVAPNIYTFYPGSLHPEIACKSDGCDKDVDYDPEDKEAVLVDGIW